jgi:hypothetical protein
MKKLAKDKCFDLFVWSISDKRKKGFKTLTSGQD